MDLVCKKDFAIKYYKTLPKDKIFVADICYKKGEDLEITTEKIFIQDKISSIYFQDGFYDMLSKVNNDVVQDETMSFLEGIYNSNTALKEIEKKWEKKFQELDENEKNQDKLPSCFLLSKDEIRKYISIMADSTARKMISEIVKEVQRQTEFVKRKYEQNVEELNRKHAEDIENLATSHKGEAEINKKVQQHLNSLDEEELVLQKSIKEIREKSFFLLKEAIDTEYKRIFEKQEALTSLQKKASKISKSSRTSKAATGYSKHKIQIVLGQQKKYPFKIKLIQSELNQFLGSQKIENTFEFHNKTQLVEKIKSTFELTSLENNEDLLFSLLNPIYGIHSSAFVTTITYDKTNGLKIDDTILGNFHENTIDLHFTSYRDQLSEHIKGHVPEEGDILVTLHSNFGYNKYIFNLVETSQGIKDSMLENYITNLLLFAIQKRVRKLIFPIELLDKKKFMINPNNQSMIQEIFMKILRMIRSGLQFIALNYVDNPYLYEIVLLIPRTHQDPEGLMNKCKDIIKKTFE